MYYLAMIVHDTVTAVKRKTRHAVTPLAQAFAIKGKINMEDIDHETDGRKTAERRGVLRFSEAFTREHDDTLTDIANALKIKRNQVIERLWSRLQPLLELVLKSEQQPRCQDCGADQSTNLRQFLVRLALKSERPLQTKRDIIESTLHELLPSEDAELVKQLIEVLLIGGSVPEGNLTAPERYGLSALRSTTRFAYQEVTEQHGRPDWKPRGSSESQNSTA